MAGHDFVSFVQNLDLLHARVRRSYPDLEPPSFRCTELQEGSFRLHYYSSREGLAPFVIGLIRGLGQLFATRVRVEHISRQVSQADHDVFTIHYERPD